MTIAIKILISVLPATAMILFLWFLRGLMLTPVPMEKSQRIVAVIEVSGASRELERTVDGLLWLTQNGTLPMEIVIADAGMDEETRRVAEILSRRDGKVSFYTGGNFGAIL